MVETAASSSRVVRWIFWPVLVAAVALAFSLFSMAIPLLGLFLGFYLGRRAGRGGLGYAAAGFAAFVTWYGLRLFESANMMFAFGAGIVTLAVAVLATAGQRTAAILTGLAGGFAVLQTCCYVFVQSSNSGILLSPWLWYAGSMFPYGGWSNSGPLMPPDFGYHEPSYWFLLSDTLEIYPAIWTFLLTFLLVNAYFCGTFGRRAG